MIEPLAGNFRQKSQDEVSILLQHGVSPPITPVSFGVSQMLCSAQFDDHAGIRAKKSTSIRPEGSKGIDSSTFKSKSTGRIRQCFQPAIEESLTGAPGAIGALALPGLTAATSVDTHS